MYFWYIFWYIFGGTPKMYLNVKMRTDVYLLVWTSHRYPLQQSLETDMSKLKDWLGWIINQLWHPLVRWQLQGLLFDGTWGTCFRNEGLKIQWWTQVQTSPISHYLPFVATGRLAAGNNGGSQCEETGRPSPESLIPAGACTWRNGSWANGPEGRGFGF